jgi:hypothetical protein
VVILFSSREFLIRLRSVYYAALWSWCTTACGCDGIHTYKSGGFSHTAQSKRKATALVKRRPRIGYVQVRGGSILSAYILLSLIYSRVSISHFLKKHNYNKCYYSVNYIVLLYNYTHHSRQLSPGIILILQDYDRQLYKHYTSTQRFKLLHYNLIKYYK